MKVLRICWRWSSGIWKKLAEAWCEMKLSVLRVRDRSSESSMNVWVLGAELVKGLGVGAGSRVEV